MEKLGRVVGIVSLQNNQIVISHKNGDSFWSYSAFIGARMNNKFYFSKLHNYSSTTSKWCCNWCGHTGKEREKMLKNKEAELVE